jgi:hypothetical protein
VLAFSPSYIYVVDDKNHVHRYSESLDAWETLHTDNAPLNDIAGASQTDLWVVGNSGTVLHWNE